MYGIVTQIVQIGRNFFHSQLVLFATFSILYFFSQLWGKNKYIFCTYVSQVCLNFRTVGLIYLLNFAEILDFLSSKGNKIGFVFEIFTVFKINIIFRQKNLYKIQRPSVFKNYVIYTRDMRALYLNDRNFIVAIFSLNHATELQFSILLQRVVYVP